MRQARCEGVEKANKLELLCVEPQRMQPMTLQECRLRSDTPKAAVIFCGSVGAWPGIHRCSLFMGKKNNPALDPLTPQCLLARPAHPEYSSFPKLGEQNLRKQAEEWARLVFDVRAVADGKEGLSVPWSSRPSFLGEAVM
ncbi:hypothetical protein HJG60_009572 [Phyllostomus discolor]|uniref:Uncharacterized protein n=1 Tax=Phyllostomus discolor TaxID=89673 RepID=A0A833YGR7_9CHIR|nr:hypothetical protein HJG60_009572 [Phyllostomus discolor]